MKKYLLILPIIGFILMLPNATLALGGPCSGNPANYNCCEIPQAIIDGGGCPTGQIWIGDVTSGSCQIPTVCTTETRFNCSNNTCYTPTNYACGNDRDVNIGTADCCADGQVVVYDDSDTNKWICADMSAGKWDGIKPGNIYYNAGNVGIGTDNPSGKLHTEASLDSTSGTQYGVISNITSSGPGITIGMRSGVSGTSNEKIGVYGRADRSEGTTAYGVYGIITGTSGTAWSGYFTGGNVYMDGNVGIGTTTPDAKLNVGYSTGAKFLLTREDSSTVDGDVLGEILFDSSDSGVSSVDAAAMIRATAFEDHTSGQKGGALSFWTKRYYDGVTDQALEHMRIESGGRIVIGDDTKHSTYPSSSLLHVSHSTTSDSGGTAGVYSYVDGLDAGRYAIYGVARGGINNYAGRFEADSYAVYASSAAGYGIYSVGAKNYFSDNVGIGISSPSYKLDVSGGAFRINTTTYDSSDYVARFTVGGSTRFGLKSNGGVVIGTNTTPPDRGLYVYGDVRLPNINTPPCDYTNLSIDTNGVLVKSGSTIYCVSSLKYKQNVQDLNFDLFDIYGLRPVSFEFNEDAIKDKGLPEGMQIGLIAEELEQVMPEFVIYDEEGRPDAVNYTALKENLPLYLVKAIQEQQKQIEDLKSRIELLESK